MRPTTKSTNGTSFHDTTIRCSVNDLREILGEPINESNDGSDKVNFEWDMETDEGEVFAIYDWKYYRPLSSDEIVTWNIGAMSKSVSYDAERELKKAL